MKKKGFSDLEYCLENVFKKGIEEKAFPGAALGFSYIKNNKLQRKFYCYGSPDLSKRRVDTNTFYDLASLTKPLVTVLSLLSLIKEKKIHWKSTLESLFPFIIPEEKRKINILQLMSHSSGLPAYRPYFDKLKEMSPALRKESVINEILKEELLNIPGKKSLYSDLSYILLGYILEQKAEKNLGEYWREKIISPLFLQEKMIFPTKEDLSKYTYASTGMHFKESSPIVHDENSRVLGGICGHAGLFGTVEGVLFLCEKIVLEYQNVFSHPSYLASDLKIALKKRGKEQWTPGFDTPSPVGSSSGRYFSINTVGHLGFTGTSFWIDLEKAIIIVLLTNRVFWGNENYKIKYLRPLVHDMVMKELIKKTSSLSFPNEDTDKIR